MDQTVNRIHHDIGDIREELRAFRSDVSEEFRALRADFSSMQDRLAQIGFSLVFALIGTVAALFLALI